MGITVHYRGKIRDVAEIESLEDCVIDLALAFGGQVQIWRSVADCNPQRAVRGVLMNLDPGQEPFSLLFSPEGGLISPAEIEEAEKHPLEELPWCFVKTQFGSVEGHAAIIETLSEIKRQFIPELQVSDESEYWTHRDPIRLSASMQQNASIINAVSESLDKHPLSDEACEDLEIVEQRVMRVVQKVHQVLRQNQERIADPASVTDDFQAGSSEIEAHWDRLYRDGTARTLRMERHIEAKLQAGHSTKEALESALAETAKQRTEAPSSDKEDQHEFESDNLSEHESQFDGDDHSPPDEPWAYDSDCDSLSNSLTKWKWKHIWKSLVC